MKKLTAIFAAFAAIVFVASCTIDEVSSLSQETAQEEIGIRTMGQNGLTKSAINGTAFPAGYDMLVSAYRNVGSHAGGDAAANYFEGIQFAKDATSGSWKSIKGAKYWPLDGTLDFLAVASAGYNTSANGIAPTCVWGESSNVAKKVVLTVPDNSVKFDDLLYGASNNQSPSAAGCNMVFKHAMTSVVFTAHCNVAYDATNNVGITIDGITIDGAKYSGTLTISNEQAGGNTSGADLSAVWSGLGDQKDHISARVWNTANLGTNAGETVLSGLNLGTTSKAIADHPFGEGYVILPEQATVTYTVHNGFASDGTTKVDNQMEYQYTPAAGTWLQGNKYIYDLVFTLTEIKINPTVVDWNNQTPAVEVPIPGPDNGHAYVDLGLRSGGNKILFATMNIGASAPEEYGDYFAWGETSKRYTSISGTSIVGGTFTSSNAPFKDGSSWTKYNTTDGKTTLEAGDDVATVLWGGSWRMPDKADLEFLLNSTYCTAIWTTQSGVKGFLITGKGDYLGNSIFLPAAGYGNGGSVDGPGRYGRYWSRSRLEVDADLALYLDFRESGQGVYGDDRYYGYSVRPVLVVPE